MTLEAKFRLFLFSAVEVEGVEYLGFTTSNGYSRQLEESRIP